MDTIQQIRDALITIDATMRGRGEHAGVLTRLDRLERAEEARVWHVRLLTAAVVTGAVKMLLDATAAL